MNTNSSSARAKGKTAHVHSPCSRSFSSPSTQIRSPLTDLAAHPHHKRISRTIDTLPVCKENIELRDNAVKPSYASVKSMKPSKVEVSKNLSQSHNLSRKDAALVGKTLPNSTKGDSGVKVNVKTSRPLARKKRSTQVSQSRPSHIASTRLESVESLVHNDCDTGDTNISINAIALNDRTGYRRGDCQLLPQSPVLIHSLLGSGDSFSVKRVESELISYPATPIGKLSKDESYRSLQCSLSMSLKGLFSSEPKAENASLLDFRKEQIELQDIDVASLEYSENLIQEETPTKTKSKPPTTAASLYIGVLNGDLNPVDELRTVDSLNESNSQPVSMKGNDVDDEMPSIPTISTILPSVDSTISDSPSSAPGPPADVPHSPNNEVGSRRAPAPLHINLLGLLPGLKVSDSTNCQHETTQFELEQLRSKMLSSKGRSVLERAKAFGSTLWSSPRSRDLCQTHLRSNGSNIKYDRGLASGHTLYNESVRTDQASPLRTVVMTHRLWSAKIDTV